MGRNARREEGIGQGECEVSNTEQVLIHIELYAHVVGVKSRTHIPSPHNLRYVAECSNRWWRALVEGIGVVDKPQMDKNWKPKVKSWNPVDYDWRNH